MHFADRLDEAIERTGNPCSIGLDPHPDALPQEFAIVRDPRATREERAHAIGDFLCEVIELVAGRVPAVKPQSAFFELYGPHGMAAWERVVAAAHAANLLVIGDVKRGDIDSTAQAYARAYLDDTRAELDAHDGAIACDAITIHPYLGPDSVRPFVETCERTGTGVYVLVRTSNTESAVFQEHGDPPLYEHVARHVVAWGSSTIGACGLSSVGAVVGATYPRELARLRAMMPSTPFLLPGYGAQGAGAADIAGGFLANGRGAIVNSSRAILFAHREARYRGLHWKDASARALEAMIADIDAVLAHTRT